MAQPVDEVVRKREGEGELDGAREDRRRRHGGGDAGALEVPPEQRRGEVAGEVDVGGAGEGAAGDARPRRVGEPRLLHLVDAQVRRHGPVKALVDEDLVAVFVGDLCRRDGAGGRLLAVVEVGCRGDVPDLVGGELRRDGEAGGVLAEEGAGLQGACGLSVGSLSRGAWSGV